MKRRAKGQELRLPVAALLAIGPLVLFLFLLSMMVSDRSGSSRGELVRVAERYGKAVVAFETAYGRPPVLGSRDWPVAVRGPLSASGPFMQDLPGLMKAHSFHFVQVGGASGAPVRVRERVELGSIRAPYVVQYFPRVRTNAVPGPPYAGYLIRIVDRTQHSGAVATSSTAACEAWGDPVQLVCGDETISRTPTYDRARQPGS